VTEEDNLEEEVQDGWITTFWSRS